jgi:hypothetical protein
LHLWCLGTKHTVDMDVGDIGARGGTGGADAKEDAVQQLVREVDDAVVTS